MPRWLRRPFVASRSLWVGGLCRRSSAGCWLACWLVSKKEATTERRAHDPNNPKSPNASPARHAPRRCLVSRRAADGRARGVRSTRSESVQQRHAAPAHAPACQRTTNDDRQTTRGDRRGETNVARRSRQPSRPGVAASHPTRGAARRGGWVRRVRRVLVGGVRGRARSRNCAVGGRRGRCPFAAATATQVQRRRAARVRRAPLAGQWCGELKMLQQVPRCPPT